MAESYECDETEHEERDYITVELGEYSENSETENQHCEDEQHTESLSESQH